MLTFEILSLCAFIMSATYIYASINSIKKEAGDDLENNVELWSNIKKVDFSKSYDNKGFITKIKYAVTYEFDYNNVHREKTIDYSIKEHPEGFKEGEKVLCIYNPTSGSFDTKENVENLKEFSYKPLIKFLLFFIILQSLMMLIIHVGSGPMSALDTFKFVTLYGFFYIAVIPWTINFVTSTLKKRPSEGFTVIKGKVIGIFSYRLHTRRRGNYYFYEPIIEFPYSGKNLIFISHDSQSDSISNIKYNINQEVDVAYDPETNYISEYPFSKKTLAITAAISIIGVLVVIVGFAIFLVYMYNFY